MVRAATTSARQPGGRLPSVSPPLLFALALLWVAVAPAGALWAQAVVPPPAVPTQARPLGAEQDLPDGLAEGAVSPGGAFLRSIVLPGWGHLATGSPTRGAFYFGAASLNTYMVVKTRHRLNTARLGETLHRTAAEVRYQAEGVMDPDSLLALVDADPKVQEAAGLVGSREQQLEDWIAWGVFMLLLGGADAYVSAHLADFPQPLGLEAAPVGRDGRVELGISVGWNGPGG